MRVDLKQVCVKATLGQHQTTYDPPEDHLKPALKRVWGKRARYTIVEDGDRKVKGQRRGPIGVSNVLGRFCGVLLTEWQGSTLFARASTRHFLRFAAQSFPKAFNTTPL